MNHECALYLVVDFGNATLLVRWGFACLAGILDDNMAETLLKVRRAGAGESISQSAMSYVECSEVEST